MKQRFKVGDTVRLKANHKARLFIIEVDLQTCYADVQQVWYSGRIHWSGKETFMGSSVDSVDRQLTKFSDIELEAIPVKPTVPGLDKLKEEYDAVTKKKDAYIKDQDFEKAVAEREKQRELKRRIDLLSND